MATDSTGLLVLTPARAQTPTANTQSTSDTLAAMKQQNNALLSEAIALRNDPNATKSQLDSMSVRLDAQNANYKAAKEAANNNGGTLPGSATTDPGVPVTSSTPTAPVARSTTPDTITVSPNPSDLAEPSLNSNNSTVSLGNSSSSSSNFRDVGDTSTVNLGPRSTASGNISNLSSEPPSSGSASTDRSTQNATTPGATTSRSTSGSEGSAESTDSTSTSINTDPEAAYGKDNSMPDSGYSPTSSDADVPASASNPAAVVNLVAVPDQRIRLTPKNIAILGDKSSMLFPLVETQGFMFPYTPIIQYIGGANYGTQALVHSNQDFRPFTSGMTTSLTIAGPFTAQTTDEAKYMMACLHFLRTVTKMRFGQDKNAGLPAPVLILNGYGIAMLNNLPVIITNFSMELPNSVDYIKVTTSGGEAWLPTQTTISVTCVVQNTPNKLRLFDWEQFASGALLKNGGWS